MARMIPEQISPEVKSNAERKIFERLQRELPKDWIVLHSLGISSHAKKPWTEVDFVVISPHGVCCVEVKGGRVARSAGEWVFTNRFGEETRKKEGPFDQVAGAAAALYKFIQKQPGGGRNVEVVYGVMMPDIRFEVDGPDIEKEVLFDDRDTNRSMEDYLRRVWREWSRKRGWDGRPQTPLDESERLRVLGLLRRDFDLVPTLRARIDAARTELTALTEEQYSVLDGLRANDRVLVLGGAGTGKTLLAVEEARRRAAKGDHVLLVCFNKNLATKLRRELEGVNRVDVEHLHGFMAQLIGQAGLGHKLPKAEADDLFRVFYPELALEALLTSRLLGHYDTLIIDEAQDLMQPMYLDVLDAILKGGLGSGRWRAFYDPEQDLFKGTADGALARLKLAGGTTYELLRNCRNTKPIVLQTFILAGMGLSSTSRVDGPKVEVHWYRDAKDQAEQFGQVLEQRLAGGLRPESLVVLGPKHLENSGIATVTGRRTVLVEEKNLDAPSTQGVRYATISSFKGLEADAVVLVDMENLESEEARVLAYVGASRARYILDVFVSRDARDAYQSNAARLGRVITK